MSTTNYEFATPVGSDIVNLLTQSNPNWVKADEVIKSVSDNAIGVATELKTGTVHALTRSTGSEDRDVFVFVATTNFVAGETFLLDNEQVTALTASGEQLSTGCYVIGSSVLVVKKGTLLTFFVPESTAKDSQKLGGELPSHYATQADLSSMQDDLSAVEQKVGSSVLQTTAQNCSDAINELNSNLSNYVNYVDTPVQSIAMTYDGYFAKQISVTVPTGYTIIGASFLDYFNNAVVGTVSFADDGTIDCKFLSRYAGTFTFKVRVAIAKV